MKSLAPSQLPPQPSPAPVIASTTSLDRLRKPPAAYWRSGSSSRAFFFLASWVSTLLQVGLRLGQRLVELGPQGLLRSDAVLVLGGLGVGFILLRLGDLILDRLDVGRQRLDRRFQFGDGRLGRLEGGQLLLEQLAVLRGLLALGLLLLEVAFLQLEFRLYLLEVRLLLLDGGFQVGRLGGVGRGRLLAFRHGLEILLERLDLGLQRVSLPLERVAFGLRRVARRLLRLLSRREFGDASLHPGRVVVGLETIAGALHDVEALTTLLHIDAGHQADDLPFVLADQVRILIRIDVDRLAGGVVAPAAGAGGARVEPPHALDRRGGVALALERALGRRQRRRELACAVVERPKNLAVVMDEAR